MYFGQHKFMTKKLNIMVVKTLKVLKLKGYDQKGTVSFMLLD